MTEMYVPAEVIADRFERLKVVIERSALARNMSRIGLVERAVVEGPSKKDPKVLSGRTRQGKLVHFAPPKHEDIAPGTFVNVRVADRAAPSWRVSRLGRPGRSPPRRRADPGGRRLKRKSWTPRAARRRPGATEAAAYE